MGISFSMANHHSEVAVIIGGGISGLSCLNAFLDRGIPAVLIEATHVGIPKMCGEFIAPPAVKLLEQWEIGPIQEIHHVEFRARKNKFNMNFSHYAGGFSRSEAELLLAKRALNKGGIIKEKTSIDKLIPATEDLPYQLELSTGEIITTKTAIFATGKFAAQQTAVSMPYYGIKLHFDKIVSPNRLLMFSCLNAYLGIIPINNTVSNCTCLIKKTSSNKILDKNYFYELVQSNDGLQQIFQSIDLNNAKWLVGHAPEFQLKKNPAWPNAFWIGDALAGIHPAIGSGFFHGILSGILAAEYYASMTPDLYHHESILLAKKKLRYSKLIHHILLSPSLGTMVLPFVKKYPGIVNWLLEKIHFA